MLLPMWTDGVDQKHPWSKLKSTGDERQPLFWNLLLSNTLITRREHSTFHIHLPSDLPPGLHVSDRRSRQRKSERITSYTRCELREAVRQHSRRGDVAKGGNHPTAQHIVDIVHVPGQPLLSHLETE